MAVKTKELLEISNDLNKEIPDTWTTVPVKTFAKIVNGGAFKSKFFNKTKGIRLVRIRDLTRDRLPTFYEGEYDESFIVNSGDFLIGMDGDFIGTEWTNGKALLNQRVCKIVTNNKIIHPKFFRFGINRHLQKIHSATSYVTVAHLSSDTIHHIEFPLPPMNEQKRIVEKIEELLSAIDSVKKSLERTKLELTQYTQSILQSAFEGKLIDTKPHDRDTDLHLLKLIEKERSNIFQEMVLKNNLSKKKLKSLPPREYIKENNPISTKKWHIVSLETVCSFVQGGSTPLRTVNSNFSTTGFPLIKVENILKNGLVFLKDNQLRITKIPHNKMWKSKVFPNDILINIVGPPLGKIGLVPENFPECNINQAIVLIRVVPSYSSKFLQYCLQSPQYYQFQLKLSTGVRQENIRKSSIGKFPIPLLSLNEQKQIVSKIQHGFSQIKIAQKIVNSTLKNLEIIKISIMKQAFEGKLIPQDPNDEPAEILLQKIKQEKEQLKQKEKSKKRKKNVK